MKNNRKITVGFDTVEPIIVLNNFSEYNIKLVEFQKGGLPLNWNSKLLKANNFDFLVFEGMYRDMEEFYNSFYETGESFEEYFNDGWE